jgi:serine/threonine-protein kinase
MGEVYRARDTKLQREVALKILLEAFALDGDRRARFEREAQLLASLNHPNIAAIYGVEDSALVLELVDGPTVADLIARIPSSETGRLPQTRGLPIEQALVIARQIAEALEAAHERGIIHRDLKPANIKVRPDGTVKVLDFGLAKGLDPAVAANPSVTTSPTLSMQATQAGIILGTAAYMSPEQAAGKAADKRSDLWAFGVVLLEMLTGRQAFTGETVPHVLASVLKSDPDVTALPADTPAAIRKLLQRCLEKDRKRRLDSAAVARVEIEDALASPGTGPAAAGNEPSRRVAWATIGATLVGGAVLAALVTWAIVRPVPEGARMPSRFVIGQAARTSPFHRNIDISPDGRQLVYVVAGGGVGGAVMVRPMDRLDATPLAGITSARAPFFSPDSQWVGFFEGTELKKAPVAGGPAVSLCAFDGSPRGASWGEDGSVVFATSDPTTGLWRVPSGGGMPLALTTPDAAKGEGDHLFPSVLPAGRGVLFTVAVQGLTNTSEIAVLDSNTNQRRMLIRGSQAQYVESGHLVYAAGGTLWAVRFDLARLQVVGDPVPVVQHVQIAQETGGANYAVSDSGTLAYIPAGLAGERSLVWVDREGLESPVKAPSREYAMVRLSPDGTRAALDIRDEENDIWILDLAQEATPRRLTYGPSIETNPVWASDTHLIFTSNRSGRSELHRQAVDGTGKAVQLTTSGNVKYATAATHDGAEVVGHQDGPSAFDVVRFRFPQFGLSASLGQSAPPDGGGRVEELVKTSNIEHNAVLSPNGRFLAYQTNESGPMQVIVIPYPQVESGKWTVSSGGGSRPVWARNGQELVYRDESGALIAVPVDTSGATFTWGPPHKLFDIQDVGGPDRSYDVSPDGRRFLMIKDSADTRGSDIAVVLDWFEELKAKVPVGAK